MDGAKVDFINPQTAMPDGSLGSGSAARKLIQFGGDFGCLRPWKDPNSGRSYITVNYYGKPVNITTNAPATLRLDQWKLMDETVLRIARARLTAWGDLMGRGLRKNIPNGLAKPVIMYQNSSDLNAATTSMDGLRQSDRDRPVFDYVNLPLPIIHKDTNYSLREVLVSQSAGPYGGGGDSALDDIWLEIAARKVAEEVEKLLLGTSGSFTYGGGTIYGYTNYPGRLTKTMVAPTGANPYSTLADILDMRAQLKAKFHFGPYMVYVSPSWDTFLDNDYVVSATASASNGTLRQRLLALPDIAGIQTIDYLPTKTMIMVEMNPEVIRGIVGLDFTTLEWEEGGGMQLNYKVMTIQVPQLRKDQLGNTGIMHGTHP